MHAGKLTPGQLYHTVVFGRRIGVNDLIGVRIVHAVFALVRIFGTVDEQLELELFVRVDGAQGFLLDIDGLGRLHRQIETDLAVGSAVAAFQIEEAQMMCRIRLGIPLLSRFSKCLGDCCGRSVSMTLNLVVLDLVGGEIDAATQRLMDTTQIKHQHTIDEHPHIVVTGEIKHHVLIVDFAIFRHIEIGPKVHAERIPIGVAVIAKRRE